MAQETVARIEDWLARRGFASGGSLDRTRVEFGGTKDIRTLLDETGCAAGGKYFGVLHDEGTSPFDAGIADRFAPANRYILVADGSRLADIDTMAAVGLSLQALLNHDTDWLQWLGTEAALLDDRVLVFRPWRSPNTWNVTAVAGDVDAARQVFEYLDTLPAQDFDQWRSPLAASRAPLADMAAFAFAEAPFLCAKNDRGDRLCDWYHGLWPYLRLFGLAATPERHAAFFHGAFTETATAGGFDRVLVCGTADYAMPAFVHEVYGHWGRTPDVTVMDLCPTPLVLCERFARHAGLSWKTVARDALDPVDGETFDLICSHSFLSRFDTQTRPSLLARWHDSLRPGGRIVTTTRLDPDWSLADAGLSVPQIEAMVAQVAQRVARWQRVLSIDGDAIVATARRYAASQRSYSVRTEKDLIDLFRGAGLRVVRLEVKNVLGGNKGRQGVPGLVKSARYADIVAERPPPQAPRRQSDSPGSLATAQRRKFPNK